MKIQKNRLLCLLLVLAMIATMMVGCGAMAEDESTEPTQNNSDNQLPALQDNVDSATGKVSDPENYGSNTLTALDNYSVTEATVNDRNMAAVVAINADSDVCLTNGELQIYYWIEFYNFMNNYGSYASMFGLDTSKPLYQQASMQEGSTWEQYFLEAAVLHYSENYSLAQAAYESGYTISEEDAANLADLDDPNGTFAAEAVENGYASVLDYIQATFGPGVGVEDYKNYLRGYYAAYDHYSSTKAAYEASLTDEAIEAYFDENAQTFEEQGLSKVNNIKVRHILISVEGETDENGEYSEAAWAEAEATANEIYEEWKKNPTEDNFSAMAAKYSTDPGSKDNGGLYDDVYPGQMTEAFNDWCFDASRAVGDHGIVKTNYGYHIMFFSGISENKQWMTSAKEDMIATHMNAFLDEVVAKYVIKFDYNKVRIFDMISAQTTAE